MYGWRSSSPFDLRRGARLGGTHPEARSLLVLVRNYHECRSPENLAGRIGRHYHMDDRVEGSEAWEQMKAYLDFLKREGVRAWHDPSVPARMSAARAGLVTYGKNCFAYARGFMQEASWIVIRPILLDAAVEPDEPSIRYGLPGLVPERLHGGVPHQGPLCAGEDEPEALHRLSLLLRRGHHPARVPRAHGNLDLRGATGANWSAPGTRPT